MQRLILIISFLFMISCAGGPYPASSPYFQIPAGSQLILKQELQILPNTGRVYIQYGKVTKDKSVDRYYPHCWLSSRKISNKPATIQPDTFTISRSIKDKFYVHSDKPLLFASAKSVFDLSASSSSSSIEYMTIMSIHSDKQADIHEFTCSHWEDPSDAYHLTVEQMNRTLGSIAEIKLTGTQ